MPTTAARGDAEEGRTPRWFMAPSMATVGETIEREVPDIEVWRKN